MLEILKHEMGHGILTSGSHCDIVIHGSTARHPCFRTYKLCRVIKAAIAIVCIPASPQAKMCAAPCALFTLFALNYKAQKVIQ